MFHVPCVRCWPHVHTNQQRFVGNSSIRGQPAQPVPRRSVIEAEVGQQGLVGRLLITKGFLGKCQPEREHGSREGTDDPVLPPRSRWIFVLRII
eukprot:gene7963-1092_t